jgi:SPP1 gp7 family putative phage head morphogenesis protein
MATVELPISPTGGGDLGMALRLPPREALRWFRRKGYAISSSWLDLAPEAHALAFTVARVALLDVLQELRRALDQAIAEGQTQRWFEQEVLGALQRLGWLPRATEPGITEPWRLQTIFRTNLQSAYMAGRYLQQREMAQERPYWQYVAVLDSRTRPAHRALHGLVFRADDPFWNTHYPPNGFNCRCRVRALSERDVRGLKVSSGQGAMVREERVVGTASGREVRMTVWGYRLPNGEVAWTDPGWSRHPVLPWSPDGQEYDPDIWAAYRQLVEGSR